MKQFYFFIFILLAQFSFSQNFTDTKGELQISGSGTAVYNLPIATPPSIQNVAPVINLTYSSGVRGGIAGQGWSINSISAISRIATRKDIDGFIDGVDFDSNDKLALDGQRLLLKTGVYWANGSTYETEFKSNSRIELKIENGFLYFIVTAPDGSRTWYASKGTGSYQNAISVNAWYIVHFEDANGNEINYNYSNVTYNSTNQLYIKTINFSGNSSTGIAFQNQIEFNYKGSSRIERDFINGAPFYATQILDNIMVRTNGDLFRKYQLQHQTDLSSGYQRVSSIQESNGSGELSNPVTFTYNNTTDSVTRTVKEYSNTLAFDKANIAGDFDGDGRLDFVADKKIFTNLFNGNTGNTPINFPTFRPALIFPATIMSNYKINQFQSIIEPAATNSQIQFVAYNIVDNNLNYTGLTASVIQTISYNNTIHIDPSYMDEDESYVPPVAPPQDSRTNEYLSGDFDGDGISEVLILSKDERYVWEEYINQNGYSEGFYWKLYSNTNSDYRREARLVSLSTGGSTLLQGNDEYYICATGKRYIADMNGDGKSDIININLHGQYSIVEINKLPSTGAQAKRIGSGTISNYSHTRQILFGDYNGDGKTDIMLPDSEGGSGKDLWHIYYSNPQPSGGEFFVKESHNIVEYWPNTGSHYDTQTHFSNYYAIDINKDGKSDIVRVWRRYYKPSWTINDHNTEWWVKGYTNNIGNTNSATAFPMTYDSKNDNLSPITGQPSGFFSDSPDIPIPLVTNYKYNGANTDLVIVRGHHNKIEYYQFSKNVDTDNRLKSVSEANGNIVQTIDYLPMVASNGSIGNNPTDFYSTLGGAYYPNIALIKNENCYLVSRLTATVNGTSKYQDFKYRSYISNYNYGTVGFAQTARSSWYLNPSDIKIWSINNYETVRGYIYSTFTHNDNTNIFNFSQSNIISQKYYNYSDYTNGLVINYRLDDVYSDDKISGVYTEENYQHDPNDYGLVTIKTVDYYQNNTLQGKTITTTSYDNNPNGTGKDYYIGRPNQINTSTTYGGETRTSEEKLSYTNGNITHTEKKGHNTYAIVEDMTYDAVGNLLTKTVSAPNALPAPTARKITDEYDATKRFVVKKTDHQNFVTSFVYNTLGQVIKSTSPLGVVSDYTFDNWGKLTKTKTTGVSAVPLETTITYAKLSDGGYTVTSLNTVGDNAKSITQYDVLGRAVITTTKGLAVNSTISKQVVYDGLGRKIKESEPYFSSPSRWVEYEYDYLMRPTKITQPTGRIQTLSYSGLNTTSVDDGKTTTATVDALGNKTQTTDPGGTITFTYYANGQLKESNYGGHKVNITIDGWGNKTAMTDPNAGTYTYSYDAFGQLIAETTPKGSTTTTYDDFGKVTKRKVSGDGADIETDYVYNSFAQLTSETSKNSLGGNIDSFAYTYDVLHRPETTTENNAAFTQTKTITYDSYGRPVTATNATQDLASGLSESVTTKNVYNTYNGIMDKLTDANDAVLWQLNTANEKMQPLTQTLGNGVAITNAYDVHGYYTSQTHTKNSINIVNNTYSFNAVKGTLNNRQNVALGTNETFTYDALDRLTHWTNPLTGTVDNNTYDDRGRITNNNKLGTVTYNGNFNTGIYQKKEIELTTEGAAYYNELPKQLVTYNMFKSPISINESDKGSTTFTYNSHLSRQAIKFGYQIPAPGAQGVYTKTKNYTDDGTVEIIKTPTEITIRTYVGGDAYGAPLYTEKTKTIATGAITDKKYYLHRDYLGSIIAISDNTGAAVERRQFDAWGNLAKLQKNGVAMTLPTNGTGTALMMLDRGYTSHEHLAEVGLIHMNGRLYDPVLRSFLMPDNFIQQPENTQNYNRYSYVLNNPLMYTDPSGEIAFLAAVGIGAAIAAFTYTVTALLADVPFSVGGLAKATFIGAATSAVTFGIGSAASTITNFYVRAAVSAVAHGTFQGGMTAISGGKFWSGFAAGALSSIAASAWSGGGSNSNYHGAGNFASSGAGMIAFGTVSGGAGAALTKGNFWQGAVTGLVVSGLNHFSHQIKPQELGNATIEVTDEIVGEQVIKDYPSDKGGRYKTPLYKVVVSGTDADGNVISKEFKAIRFGVKTNSSGLKSIVTLKAGTYVIKDFLPNQYSNTGAFHIKGDYLIHLNSINGADGNNGCIAISGGRSMWNQFKSYVTQLTFNSDLSNAARNGNIILNVRNAPKLF
jgi:RHS repeat-associated protein